MFLLNDDVVIYYVYKLTTVCRFINYTIFLHLPAQGCRLNVVVVVIIITPCPEKKESTVF